MSYYDSLSKLEIDLKEYCFLMESTDKYSDKFKVYIPKLMPLFNVDEQLKVWKENFINDIFVNADECKITYINNISLQNFLTIYRKRNSWFKFHPSMFEKGTRLLCEIPEKNIRHIRIVDDEFNVDKAKLSKEVFVRNPSFEILDKISIGDIVKVSYVKFIRTTINSVDSSTELDSEGINEINFYLNLSTEEIDSERRFVNKLEMFVGDGQVMSKHEWGLVVSVDGVNRHITPDRVIGFHKKPGEYYSYFEDSYNGGA